ncbi:MAG: hypothetical protein ACKVN9_04310 [Methylophilaceae bacterium]
MKLTEFASLLKAIATILVVAFMLWTVFSTDTFHLTFFSVIGTVFVIALVSFLSFRMPFFGFSALPVLFEYCWGNAGFLETSKIAWAISIFSLVTELLLFYAFEREQKQKIIHASALISTSLELQLILIKGDSKKIENDLWALGYVFGFHDAVYQALKIDNMTESMAYMCVSYDKLFGSDKSKELYFKSIDSQQNKLFQDGMMVGGRDLFEFIKNQNLPMRLTKHLER